MPTNKSKRVTLSFDNGPDPETTPFVLDVLARRGVKSTFFVVGQKLEKSRASAQRAVAEGHWIGNHTWSHSHPFRTKGDIEFVRSEIDHTQAEIGVLAHKDRLFRPYGGRGQLEGALNTNAVNHLAAGGYTCILWNAIPGDFDDQNNWPDVAHEQVVTRDWPLIVLHDIHAVAMSHLDGFIGALQDKGYSIEQQFPPSCIAMQNGTATRVMSEGVLAD